MELEQGQQARSALGRDPVLTRGSAERAFLTIGVAALFASGYFGVARSVDPARARELGTALDRNIPFVASSVWVYLCLFPVSFLPLFVVRCKHLFRRTILAYAIAIALSLIVFAAVPVTSIGLRADRAALDTQHISPFAVSLLYRLDPPFNLFPSLHLSIATLAALSVWKAARVAGPTALAGVAAIGTATCTVKQHFVLDGLAGIALAALVYAVVLRPYEAPPGLDGISPSPSRNDIR